jgi:CDP-diacylglycerol---glycerol-3-phosphate 3-phosphatidyltransferase
MSNEGYRLEWPDPNTHPHNIESKAEKALTKLQASFMSSSTTSQHVPPDTAPSEVLVFPIVQAGQFNIREEEQCLSILFNHLAIHGTSASLNPTMDLTSGYFGLYKPYQDLILRSSIDCRIVAASPMVNFRNRCRPRLLINLAQANGFYGSRGLSGRIPDGYTLLEQRFIKAVNAARRNWSVDSGKGIRLNEWAREGWTYHAKGSPP